MKNKLNSIFWLALSGVLFSGYLTYKKLFSGTCALTEGCSYFMGTPTCFFGFLLFSLILIISIFSFLKKTHYSKTINVISFLGISFSGYFSIYEMFFAPLNLLNGAIYTLGLPSCFYGFLMFVVVFIISIKKTKINFPKNI